jgi:putative FmdB family regulatory protein
MPIYDYKCQQCAKEFTVQASMKDPEPTVGPSCDGPCLIQKCLSRVFGQVAGAHPAPVERPKSAPQEKPSHVCSKYCDLHK